MTIKPVDAPGIPDAQDRRRIAAEAAMPERQVLLAYRDPDRRRPSVLSRIRRAAALLGLPMPTSPPVSITGLGDGIADAVRHQRKQQHCQHWVIISENGKHCKHCGKNF